MILRRSVFFVFCVFFMANIGFPLLYAQGEASSDVASPVVEPSIPTSSTEILNLAISTEDPDTRYHLIGLVSPRDMTDQERDGAVELLVKLLGDDYPDIRGVAAETLGLFEEKAAAAVPALIGLLGDTAMKLDLQGVWVAASRALGQIGSPAIAPLMESLRDCDRPTYFGIVGALSEMGPVAEIAAPPLIEILQSGPDDRRWATMMALSAMGKAALPAIPEYIKQLESTDFNTQVAACRALASLGPEAKDAAPKLRELVEQGLLSTRTHAAMCLGSIGPVEGIDTVELLMQMAQEKNAFCQERSMIALGRLGKHASKATELVRSLIKQDDFSQKPEAVEALWRITGENQPALDLLAEMLDSKTYDSRVMTVLSHMGPQALPMADRLTEMLSHEDQSIRLMATSVLGNMGPGAVNVLPSLRAAIADSDRDVALAIDKAIAAIQVSQFQ